MIKKDGLSGPETSFNKQFSVDVIDFQSRVEDVIAWLYSREEQLKARPSLSILQDATLGQVLEEYSKHENFICDFCDYSRTIIKCKEDGEAMRDSVEIFNKEDRDELGIQIDSLNVCYEKLKILVMDRLNGIRAIIETRQRTKIESLENWISVMELKLSNSINIGPNSESIQRQLKEVDNLRIELEQKQDLLEFMSNVVVFDDVDPDSFQIQGRSSTDTYSIEERLVSVNRRWTDICRRVEDVNKKLKKADSLWKLLEVEGPLLLAWLRKIEVSVGEIYDGVMNQSNIHTDHAFLQRLSARSDKIDYEIKTKQPLYTRLENTIRAEIEKFDDPCSMMVIELEKKLEDMQDYWNSIMNSKRKVDYKLQALSNSEFEASTSDDSLSSATLAQQQEELLHTEEDLQESAMIRSGIEEAELFLKLCDSTREPEPAQSLTPDVSQSSNNDVWLSFKDLREVSERQSNRLANYYQKEPPRCTERELEEQSMVADKDRWFRLVDTLRSSCDYLIEQMGRVMPESNIGVDLITLAQQQDELLHTKANLEEDSMIHSAIEEAKLYLKLCDAPQNHEAQAQMSNVSASSSNDVWQSFKNLRETVECQLDRLTIHYSELSQLLDDRLERLDEIHKEMHTLQHRMQELASELQVVEIMKSNWQPLTNLDIEKLSEQLEDLKLYRERLNQVESIHNSMSSIFDWMTQSDVPLSQRNLNQISELNTIWSLIQVSVEKRQKLIEQAFDEQGSSKQKFLEVTVSDLPKWERRVATSKVPYFFDRETNKTHWDHPKFDDLLKTMSCVKQIVFSAYRTALKLRMVQKKLSFDLLMLEQLREILDTSDSLNPPTQDQTHSTQYSIVNDATVGMEEIIEILKTMYERIQSEEKPSLDIPLSIDLALNWLLNLYDSTRTGKMSIMSLKVGLALVCCATREEKYIYMYNLICNPNTGSVDARKLGALFETCMRVPIYLGEGDSFGGMDIIETSIRNCFSMSKFNPQQPNCIDMADYLSWLKTEPQFIIWLPVLHRLLISENTSHRVKCKLCGANPIIGLRYRCLKCFKFNICQNCFLTGRHIYEHHDPAKHPMREYCSETSSGENVRDFTKILRNKLNPIPMTRSLRH